jgi:hypothetical protein
MRIRAILTATLLLAGATAATAKEPPRERPEALSRLLRCRAITVEQERLACFDREAASMDAAVTKDELVVMDRNQIRKTRSSLFGLTLPNLAIFGADKEGGEGVSHIESTVRSASEGQDGNWYITLADGARWQQIDGKTLSSDPKAGNKIVIRKAALGSYMAKVNDRGAFRVRRVN